MKKVQIAKFVSPAGQPSLSAHVSLAVGENSKFHSQHFLHRLERRRFAQLQEEATCGKIAFVSSAMN